MKPRSIPTERTPLLAAQAVPNKVVPSDDPQSNELNNLPVELMAEVLSYLDLKDLGRFARTSTLNNFTSNASPVNNKFETFGAMSATYAQTRKYARRVNRGTLFAIGDRLPLINLLPDDHPAKNAAVVAGLVVLGVSLMSPMSWQLSILLKLIIGNVNEEQQHMRDLKNLYGTSVISPEGDVVAEKLRMLGR